MIVKSSAHDAPRPSHDRDFRTPGFALSSIFAELPAGRLMIFDVGRGTTGYDASVHLFYNSGEVNGNYYIDMIAHRHHMRWGKLIEDLRPMDVGGWETSCSTVSQYPVQIWPYFVQFSTDAATIVPTPFAYCKRKRKSLPKSRFYKLTRIVVDLNVIRSKQKG